MNTLSEELRTFLGPGNVFSVIPDLFLGPGNVFSVLPDLSLRSCMAFDRPSIEHKEKYIEKIMF